MKKIIVSSFILVLAVGIQNTYAQSTAISSVSDQPNVQSTQANQNKLNSNENSSIAEQKQTSVNQAEKSQANGSSTSIETISSVSDVPDAKVATPQVSKAAAATVKQPSSID